MVAKNYRRITPQDNLIFNEAGDLIGIQNPNAKGADLDTTGLSALVSGDGIPPQDYRTSVEQAISAAFRLRAMQATPTVPVTAPTNKSSGSTYYIDYLTGANAAAGTAAAPWKDAWKLPGSPPAGSTIFIAADQTYEYAETWTAYRTSTLFSTGNLNGWIGTAAAPITMRPYYPRGVTTAKPRIMWYALLSVGDWTQEAGISGGKVWSAVHSNQFNLASTIAYFGAARTPGVAYEQQAAVAPALLSAAGHYTVDSSKLYVYVPDGTNPQTYYGEVRVSGGNTRGAYSGWNNTTAYVRFYGLRFELCPPMTLWSGQATAGAEKEVELDTCDFIKCPPMVVKNAATNASAQELSYRVHDCYFEDVPWTACRNLFTAGTSGNTVSWEWYRNRVNRGCVTSGIGGALLYNQCIGGTKCIAWGNYIYGAINSVGNEAIDGAGIYSDVNADKAIFAGNIFERCGKGIQVNSQSGMSTVVGNLAIDCGSFGSATNTTGDLKAPSLILAHNTYLWTGRIQFTDLKAGPNIGGTSVRDWSKEPAFEITNSQANTAANTAYNFASLSLANNLAINLTGAQLSNKTFGRIPAAWTTTLMVAGNASAGMASAALIEVNVGTDYTYTAKYLHLVGAASEARNWLSRGAEGIARPTPGSPLVSAGAQLSQQYQDIGGRNFAAAPTIGCYEVNA